MKTTNQMPIQKMVLTLGIALSMVISLPGRATAQGMPVYDNTNFITLGKQIIESAKQTSELLKTVEFLREQKERIEKVNDVIKQLKAVRELTRNNGRLFDMVRNDLRDILDSPISDQRRWNVSRMPLMPSSSIPWKTWNLWRTYSPVIF